MTSSTYKFKMAARQNLTRTESCCLPFGWHLPVCFIEWLEQKWCPKSMRRVERGGYSNPSRRGGNWQKEDGGSPPQCTTHPQPESPHPWERRRRGWKRQRSRWRRQDGWSMWAGHNHCHQPNSWLKWLQRLGHLIWEGRSQSGGSSNLLWEAKPPRRNSSGLVR